MQVDRSQCHNPSEQDSCHGCVLRRIVQRAHFVHRARYSKEHPQKRKAPEDDLDVRLARQIRARERNLVELVESELNKHAAQQNKNYKMLFNIPPRPEVEGQQKRNEQDWRDTEEQQRSTRGREMSPSRLELRNAQDPVGVERNRQ